MNSRDSFISNFKSIFDCKTNKEIYNQQDKPLYIKKAECNDPEWQGEWDRVQELRKNLAQKRYNES